jgi:hypothetical protein
MQHVLPANPLREIPAGSPVYFTPNDVRKVGVTPMLQQDLNMTAIAPKLEGVDFNGHYSVIYSPYGMAGCWDMFQSPYALGYNDIEALRLGQNILFYAITH